MTELQFVTELASQTGTSRRDARRTMHVAFNLIDQALHEDGRFFFPGFGTWRVGWRKARKVVNPSTGELMRIPKNVEIRFKASKRLRNSQRRRRAS
jgi:DNA-binding protein HU-beta